MNKWWIALKLAWEGRKWFKSEKAKEKDAQKYLFVPFGESETDKYFNNGDFDPKWYILDWAYSRGFSLNMASDTRCDFKGQAWFQTGLCPTPVPFPVYLRIRFDEEPNCWEAWTYLSQWGCHPELKGTFLDDRDFFENIFLGVRLESNRHVDATYALKALFKQMEEKIALLPSLKGAMEQEKNGASQLKNAIRAVKTGSKD